MAISINLYLDTRYKRNGQEEFPVKITITKDGSTADLATGINVHSGQWKERRVTGRKDKARINDYLEGLKSRARSLCAKGISEGSYQHMSAAEIKNDLSRKLFSTSDTDSRVKFMSVFDEYVKGRNSDRTKEIYRITRTKILQEFPSAENMAVEAVSTSWLEALDEKLIERGNNGSTRNLDFRNIRAVIKYAIKRKFISFNPFDDFEMPDEESPDRALTCDQMRSLIRAEVNDAERKYLDFFLLSFYLMGINTGDLMYLKRIEDGRVNYTRKKTGVSMSVKVEKEAQEIINRNRGVNYLINIADTYHSPKSWTSKVDHVLKSIAEKIGLPPISMYWTRHTWATIAGGDLGEDEGRVGDGLGHKPSKKVTHRYIRRKNFSKVDALNRKVIDYVLSIGEDEGSPA